MSGTEGNIKHPVHLHLSNISTPDASVSALLNPVLGQTGISETSLTILADESSITYQQLIQMDACIKVHLSDARPTRTLSLLVEISVSLPQKTPLADEAECMSVKANKDQTTSCDLKSG